MKKLTLPTALAALTVLLSACHSDPSFPVPSPAPSNLDFGPHNAALGQNVTITGPGGFYSAKPGAKIIANGSGDVVYGQLLGGGKIKLTLSTPPASSKTGPIQSLIPKEMPLYFPDQSCLSNTLKASNAAQYAVPEFLGEDSRNPISVISPVLPFALASGKEGYIFTGRLVHVDQDVTLQGDLSCHADAPIALQTVHVNVTLKAGWNVLREQSVTVKNPDGSENRAIAIVGGADDYTVGP